MSDIPATWLNCHLGDVVDYGKTVKAEPSEIPKDSWVLELEDIEKDSSRLIARKTFAERQSKSTKNYFQPGDVLYGKLRPYLNKVLIADSEGYCTTEIVPVSALGDVDNRYLFYWLKHPFFLEYVGAVSHGLNMPRLGTEAGVKAPFVLAPLNEQKRIADKLDSLLAKVDACRDRLDRVPQILKRFRQSVLAAAFDGILTKDWRLTRGEPAEYRTNEFVLNQCGAVSGGLTKNPKRSELKMQKPYLRVANVYSNRLELDQVSEIGLTESEYQNMKLAVGDLLIVEGNGSLDQIGRAAIWRNEIPDIVHQNHLIRWRTKGPDPRFVLFWLMSPGGRDELMRVASSSAGLYTLSISKIGAIPMRLPAPEEQAEIVRRIDMLFAYADSFQSARETACSRIKQLTAAILGKAFRGELVPQDPNDEPASVLLERIRAAKASTAAQAPRVRRVHVETKKEIIVLNRQELPKAYLTSILKTRGPLSAESLWSASNLEIDDFYDVLREEESGGLLKEIRGEDSNDPRLLEAA